MNLSMPASSFTSLGRLGKRYEAASKQVGAAQDNRHGWTIAMGPICVPADAVGELEGRWQACHAPPIPLARQLARIGDVLRIRNRL